MGGGKGGGSPALMPPMPASDNSELYMAMMEQQNQQNQQMMQMIAEMMAASQDDSQPLIVMPGGSGQEVTPYQSVDFSGARDQLHEQAAANVSDEASNRTGRSSTIISSPRLDRSAPVTTGNKGQVVQEKSLLSDDENR